ncbi:thioredoxin 2 [Plasmodium berghei]|uniref:Thioredoxin 2 n=2 Tax=Plasmodium berghei TaxID=5821 RepID=THIO2_PLABA|nr:thioredoxin 2 [Plasmodium berghei ANKA]A0A509AQW5.1 RecName: Full=Thioredoxin 2; Short=PbTRX2; Flags: Precursor [Plasmodium berghei ANKA]CXJ03841.1 thioredoxin 2 [Plasmodium berghei]SCL98557.1 thioredoxin 2 [Plasmodium berghei]SCM16853.1 thioredoxin 2 [Plasmodium berghei]SCM18651.1 thioredoxin 2 [Plasmodium berghei]SCN28086.1 thioredoxin 2 [Plasmodium berghei]|eukprot:XP_034423736.1 thioredoxin 2 [Plasmodium berghei ANKA]
MKHILALVVFIISFFCFKDVNCIKDFQLSPIESPLTALNKYDKFFLRMYNKMPRLEQSSTDYINGINMKNTIFVLYFYAKWCHACKLQGPELDKLEKNFGKKVHIIRIDIDNNEEIAKKNFIKALPTTIIIKNKVILAKNEHFVTSNELTSTIRKHL